MALHNFEVIALLEYGISLCALHIMAYSLNDPLLNLYTLILCPPILIKTLYGGQVGGHCDQV